MHVVMVGVLHCSGAIHFRAVLNAFDILCETCIWLRFTRAGKNQIISEVRYRGIDVGKDCRWHILEDYYKYNYSTF